MEDNDNIIISVTAMTVLGIFMLLVSLGGLAYKLFF